MAWIGEIIYFHWLKNIKTTELVSSIDACGINHSAVGSNSLIFLSSGSLTPKWLENRVSLSRSPVSTPQCCGSGRYWTHSNLHPHEFHRTTIVGGNWSRRDYLSEMMILNPGILKQCWRYLVIVISYKKIFKVTHVTQFVGWVVAIAAHRNQNE